MQIAQYRPKYFEKILRTPKGLVKTRFIIVSEGSSFKVKIVEMIPLHLSPANNLDNSIYFLDCPKSNQIFTDESKNLQIQNPYIDLLFFISQPTRAPAK